MSVAPEKTYWDIVKTQFKKHRTAVWGLRLVIGLFALAVAAPVVATSSPFTYKPEGGERIYPWFADLLDQNVFPTGVDLFFNLLLIFAPFGLASFFLGGRFNRKLQVGLGALFLWSFASVAVPAGLVESGIGKVIFLPQHVFRYSSKKVDWVAKRRAELEPVLCREKIALYEKKTAESIATIEELDEVLRDGSITGNLRFNLQAERGAEKQDLKKNRRQLARWQDRAKEADAFAEANSYSALMPPIGYHHDDNDKERITEGPTFTGWGVGHIMGTDGNGRDVMARLIYGIRVSLTVGVIAVGIYCTIGAVLGSLMGYFGGWVDIVLMRFVEIMICFPYLAFILIIVSVFQSKNIFLIVVGIALIGWTGAARLIRGQFLQEKANDYVSAARALGIPTHRIVFKHVLPNAIHPLFVTATFGVAAAILTEASLAFLGLGDPNVPSWGQILLEGRITSKLWLIFGPGAAIFFTVTVLNLVGEGLRDALDPKLRQ